jgi:sulfur relay (sulfurtransferase) complex TusBCD TusD component (DsrE family)
MRVLVVANDPAYGNERSYNALRLAGSLAKRDGVQVRVFLMGDAVGCAAAGQQRARGRPGGDVLKQLLWPGRPSAQAGGSYRPGG